MKKLLYISLAIIIGGIIFIKFFNINKTVNIEKIKNSIVIIIPETELISYKNNPGGLFEEYKESGIGAGFFISNDGTIQTVNHLVEDDKINYKVLYNNKEYKSKVISRDKDKDLATLKIISTDKTLFTSFISNNKSDIYFKNIIFGKYNKEMNVISFGIDNKNLKIIYNTGIILDQKSKLDNMSNLLEISNILKPGFSGGPIIDTKGNVIGINYAISEGKNYGITF